MIVRSSRQYGVKALCAYFGISRAAYYARLGRWEQVDRDRERLEWVQEAYVASHRTYGYRRIQLWLAQRRKVNLNHKTVLRLMNKLGIHSIARRRKIYQRMAELESVHTYPNVLEQDFVALRPNQKWVTEGLILHSDHGNQYRSQLYFDLTCQYHITPSMSRRGNCWDNAPMENFFSHLKAEAMHHLKNPSFEETRQTIDEYIYFYNYDRIQLKTRQTPYERRCLSR